MGRADVKSAERSSDPCGGEHDGPANEAMPGTAGVAVFTLNHAAVIALVKLSHTSPVALWMSATG
jgi:hypothetical protein